MHNRWNLMPFLPFLPFLPFSQKRLVELIDDANIAYQDARWRVWDQLDPGQPIDVTRLSQSQQSSLTNLQAAETAVAQYRALAYSSLARS